MAADGLVERGDGGAHRGAVDVARVHPAEQRLDEPVDDLASHAGGDVLTERGVLADLGARQFEVLGDPAQAVLGEDAGERLCVAGYAHHMPLGHGDERAPVPETGARDRGRLQGVAEAHRAGEADAFCAAGEHGLGAEVGPYALDLARQQLAAQRPRALQDGHAHPGAQQPVGGREAGDAAADDDDVARTCVLCVRTHGVHSLKPLPQPLSESRT